MVLAMALESLRLTIAFVQICILRALWLAQVGTSLRASWKTQVPVVAGMLWTTLYGRLEAPDFAQRADMRSFGSSIASMPRLMRTSWLEAFVERHCWCN
mmetsp:Transcript_34846/g.55475  ORF Transcript_34846/g.55475 Transcript_34846/m.55475 type:complete len:99 (-) Transcript_34846:51-347(-)